MTPPVLPHENRWHHVQQRLRFRYGLEITMEEYLDLCAQFSDGRARGVRPDERDELEGWVLHKGTWVAAKYMRATRLITTVLPTMEGRPDEEISRYRKELAGLHKKLEEVRAKPQVPATPPGPRRQAVLHALEEARSVAKKDAVWFKQQCVDALRHLKQGRPDEASAVLDAACRLPKNAHPGKDS